MQTGRIQKSVHPCKLSEGFQSKVVAPRNPKLIREEKKKDAPLTPSTFLKEMSLTTEQKLACTHEMCLPRIIQLLDMSETSHQKFSSLDLDQSLFQPFPSEVIFQNFAPCEIYEVPLILRNNDKIPRLVKVVLQSSPYFQVISPNNVCNKVAPGMPSTFRILFTPEENKDYLHEVTCITEREKFIVPIRAIGARGILDFPDQLNFSTCPVKYNTQKTLLVRNIGNREARYQISTKSPFAVEPSTGTLGVGETTQFTVEFLPQETGNHCEDLVVHYDTGEDIHVRIYGAAADVNVRLEKNSLTIEKTYVTLANQRSVAIHNRSNIIAHFQWKFFATQAEEEQKKQLLCRSLQVEEESVVDHFLEECITNPTLREHLSIVTRTFRNRQAAVYEDPMLFNNNIFTIEPLQGDVWPNSTTEVSVIFRPQEAGIYHRTVYCDISGRENRLPLRIKGEAMGPKLLFNFDQLNIGKIFIGSSHSYEAILSNQGAIDALFNLTCSSTLLGSRFNFQPNEGIILPGGHQAIQITFSSTILGEFCEEFQFNVNGSPQPVNLTIRGCVIGPTFHFNIPSLNFGDVSYGFPHTLSCCLSNTSLVPMTFSLRVPGDGCELSVESRIQASDITREDWKKAHFGNLRPKEFTITPTQGTIRSQGLMNIQVTLCSNTVKKYETALVVDVTGIGEEVLALLITARCITPALRVANPTVDFGRCFLKFPYQQMVRLVNDSDLPGCYGLLPQEYEENPTVLHSSPAPCGIIPPRATVEIPVTLEAQKRGHQEAVAHIAIFGSGDPPLVIELVTFGEGPVVYVHPAKLDFGSIQVLQDISRMLYLSNQSFIPAPFEARMARSKSLWKIEPSKGVVPPEAEISITLIAHLDDTVQFQDTVHLAIKDSISYVIPIQATGIGTTIVTDKPFAPAINLGPHFSLDPCSYHFKVTNRGRRTHQLYWMTEGFAPFCQLKAHLAASANAKNRNSHPKQEPRIPVFKLQPLRMELAPGKSMDMMLEGCYDTPRVVKERLLCHAIIGKQSGKERIMTVDVTCEFIAPVLQISSSEITFQVEKSPGGALTTQYEPLSLKNVSSLPLNVLLTLQDPFFLCNNKHQPLPAPCQPILIDIDGEHHLCVGFDPTYRDDLYNRVAEEVLTIRYLEHPHVDHVKFRGEVRFPNLHFQTLDLNFGCILNDTEVIRYVDMTNCSPLAVKYRWSFLPDDPETQIRDEAIEESLSFTSEEEVSVKQLSDAGGDTSEAKASLLSADDVEEGLLKKNQAENKEVLWCIDPEEHHATGVEEVFDVLPLYGILEPDETQQMSFTFYGHANIVACMKALCFVEGGPTYEILLRGEASLVSYAFDIKEIDYGLQPFDQVCEAEITLRNTGKVGFQYTVLDEVWASASNPPPGVPLTLPVANYIESQKEQVLKVYYLPGVPEVFQRTFKIQVAHLEPDSITLKGEGVFPRIYLDLPRNLQGNEHYSSILREAKQHIEHNSQKDVPFSNLEALDPPMDECIIAFDTQLQMEVERLLVQQHALEQQRFLACEDPAISQRARRRLAKAQLPEYILDFGYIILGTVRTHIVKITNTSHFPVSFHADKRHLRDTGFTIELDRVKNLPYCETETFEIRFDPQSANQPLGELKVLLPIKVVSGPTFHISLRATVIMPSLCMSSDNLEFSAVQCGQCQMETIQFHNQLQVTCEWFATSNEQTKKVDKHMPAALRRKMRQELKSKPHVFEMIPPYGILSPGERLNVQVKFAPREEKFYSNHLIVSITQSTHQLLLHVSGHGLEPRLEFTPAIVELGPLLPYALGDEAEVVVRNPCSFPIELYSLELDQQYLLEERILRMLKGYDSHKTLLLPPRLPGEKLPPEVLEFYEEQKKLQSDQESVPHDHEEEENTDHRIKALPSGTTSTGGSILLSATHYEGPRTYRVESKFDQEEEEEEEGPDKGQAQVQGQGQVVSQQSFLKQKETVGELDNNPVSRAIARHLGIDISPEGRAARNRRGIAIVIHGAPLTGKTSAAITLAKLYSAACLSIDSVVIEAISDGSSPAGLRARELCIRAAIEQAQRETDEAGADGQPVTSLGTRLSAEALAKHTSEGSQPSSESKMGPQSTTSRGYRGSSVMAKGKSEGHGSQAPKQLQHQQSDQPGSQIPSSPIPSIPIQRRISISASIAGDSGLMSCVFPEELLVEILTERMQLSDCYRGVVIDGLESLFARNIPMVLQCVLKAINNRRHIYFVNLFQDFAAMKAREKARQEQEEREQQEAAAREKVRLQEMDEEEYDALTEEQKIQFDRELLQALRERKKREMEKLVRELEEKKHQQELERLREEEEMKKKSKRYKRDAAKEKEDSTGKKGQAGGKQDQKLNDGVERKTSAPSKTDRPEVNANDRDEKKRKSKQMQNEQQGGVPPTAQEEEETEKEMSESEKNLAQRFKLYEASQKDIVQILLFWDRVQGVQQSLASEEKQEEVEDQRQAPSGRKGRKDRERERQERLEKERAEKERLEKEKAEKERLERLIAGQEGEGEGADTIGIPCLEIQVLSSEDSSGKRIQETGKLPGVEQILDALGLGPSGPPIPPTAFFSVIPYPEKRQLPVPGEALKHFTFIVPEDTNVPEDDKKDAEASAEITSSLPAVKEQSTPTRGKSKKEKVEPTREPLKDKKGATRSRKGTHPSPGTLTPLSELDQSALSAEPSAEKLFKLTCFRWTVPANGEILMRLHFSSTKTGLFDQVFNFEIQGTRRQYQVYCRGVCTYPTISQDPRIVFPHRRKTAKPDEIVFKKYIMSSGVFHFGPLLCGKSRDKYKANRFPNHSEKITILNISPLECEITFCFQHDYKAVTYLLDPPAMTLKPNEQQKLTVWAYPTGSGIFEDSIVCCIKENPQPVTFRLCCQGVRPELELDRRQLHFEKLLLHRKEAKSLFFKNNTPLPVAWRISGLENMGEDFSVSDDMGIVEAFSEYCLQVYFKASKVVNVRKAVRLEVSDAENILGIVQIENIQIIAEAYDVALDISFPKGTDGTLDFGFVKVMDEAKQSLSLKNKGKYEIGYSFAVESTEHGLSSLSPLFSIQPSKGNLGPNDRPTMVQIIFRSKKEVNVEDKPILICHVIEPSLCEGGEIIASIPVRLTVHSLFTKYNISPPPLINFGPVVHGSRKSCSFIIENKGCLEFKFAIFKQVRDNTIPLRKGTSHIRNSRSREGDIRQNALLGRQSRRSESIMQKDVSLVAQARFSLGMFCLYPGFGSISPGGQQVINVDCIADPIGKCEEYLTIEISDRDPEDNPNGITYTLIAESCMPSFVTDDVRSIFEEHQICNSRCLSQVLKDIGCDGVFVTDENKFIFNNVLVGHQATAHFKICNHGRIPCDVLLAVKPISPKSAIRVSDIFEVHPARMSIASRAHAFATVTFLPQTMQNYQCIFEASVDPVTSMSVKSRSLLFEVTGDGNLPQVTIVRPAFRNKKGNPLILFKKLLLGNSETLPLVLKNSSSIPAQLHLDVSDEHGAFILKPKPGTNCIYVSQAEDSESSEGGRKPHTASLVLHCGESAEFSVVFQPTVIQHIEGLIHLSIVDNQYEETTIQMVGEGYQDDVTLDNITSLMAEGDGVNAERHLEDDIAEARTDYIQFGDCYIGKTYQTTFTITNHSKSEVMRFEWPVWGPLQFSPQVGHLHAGCAKHTILTLKSSMPIAFRAQPMKCKVCRIVFQQPAEQVPDWDDRLHTVKWVDISKTAPHTRPSKKKVIETDPEPVHTVVEDSGRELELCVSATIDYAQYEMEVDPVHFRDTLLFQTRVFKVELFNTGIVQLEYFWKVVMEDSGRAVNFAKELSQHSRPLSQLGSVLDSFSSYLFPAVPRPPFSIEPSSGIIPSESSQVLQVKFSPQELGEFEGRLLCSISNLKLDEEGPVVSVKGKSLLPYCHFELEESDYITANRRHPDLRGPGGPALDPSTKVIEFTSIGVRVRNTKSFAIMNPTNASYAFHWTCEQQKERKEQAAFVCFTERGQLRPEKRVEIIFEFFPEHLDVTESFWTFSIPEHNISVPFLLVGHTADPAVSLDRHHINFHSVLIGHEARDSINIINNENETFNFAVRESSRFSEGRINYLQVQPMEGSIPPCSRVPVNIFFMPTLEGEVNFNLICDVNRKTHPLCLNVKATGHTMNLTVKYEESSSVVIELDSDQVNTIHFKEMQVNDYAQYTFHILNTGKFNFTFTWEFHNTKELQRYFAISPNSGIVEVGERTESVLSFHPLKTCTLKDVELRLQISHGPMFICALRGTAVSPSIHFSFTKVDFGNCFIYHAGMTIPKRILTVTNKADRVVSLDCLFTSTPYLEVAFHGEVLNPGGKTDIPFTFYPREAISYHEAVTFEINGLSQRIVEVLGKGIEMKINVQLPNKVLKFGAVPPGHTVKKTAILVNNSVCFVSFNLSFMSSMPELQEAKVLTMSPSTDISLKPKGGTCRVEVTFSPKSRILPFTEEVLLECHGTLQSLFAVQGCCQGIEVSLDQTHIPFGAVVLRSQASRRITMQNTGDIGVGFKWDVRRFKPDFSIKPVEGYISPGMDVSFEVTFHPCELSQDICYENLQCQIQGIEPLKLTLSGCCVGVPPVKEVVNFQCQVRAKNTQTIMLSNRSNQPWTLRPIIEGEQWKGPEFIRVEAHQQNKPYEITYRPLSMNVEGKKDQGSIFFPLPDGTGLLYLLQGTTESPKSTGNFLREVPCKTPYTELLPISNWLNKPQRFRVTLDMIKPERLEVTTTLKTLDYIDVPASAKKDHKLNFFSYKEGMYCVKVTFRNEVTQEYLFYLITFKAIPCGPLGTIELTTSVRQSISSTLKVENPLQYPVNFNTDCKVPDISLPPQIIVPAQSEGVLTFEFQPMRPGETTGRLTLNSNELGSFQYDVILKSTPARPERALHFCTMLGSSQNLITKFVNYTRQKTEYATKIDSPDFHVDKCINAAAGSQTGTEVSVEVTFEPCQLGETRGTLVLSSAIGGDYTIPLFGTSVLPKPQGPFQIRAGSNTTIVFKNVFLQPMTFSYAVENPAFTVKAPENIRPKKTASIVISFDPHPGGSKVTITSKLVVSCPRATGVGSGVFWVYYLKGIMPEK
uniref:hydrocephalus-inducing protein homolog n=1 Tax=Euleptes europaea TaxID=460621 RepID=UPI00253F703F|nr:hydrocephalus-inducing protein homolog [Euleptes europaea]